MMYNESFLTAVAFVVFIMGVFKPAKKVILNMLDAYTAKALKSLDEAKKMREEASKILENLKVEHVQAKEDAKAIIAKAHKEAELILSDAKKEAERITGKRSELALQRIIQQEEQMIRDIKNEAIELALASVQQTLLEELDKNAQFNIMEDNIKSFKKLVH